MKLEKLFEKAGNFFLLKKSVNERKGKKKEKLIKRFIYKLGSLKQKLKTCPRKKERKGLREQLRVLNRCLKILKER
ncbi:MAG: hypothetical protein GQ474_02535 [Sulfurimonas sp.]|nr:hypothetical protein [Sulfurimonas sp.]